MPLLLLTVTSIAMGADDAVKPATAAAQRDEQIAAVLSDWESASQDVIPPSAEDEHVAYMVHKSKSSGHEIAVALEFQSPVDVDQLRQKYDWKKIAQVDNKIVLTAEPIESVEQLFYQGFELELDAETHLPAAIRFIDRNGKAKDELLKLAARTRRFEERPVIQLATAISTSPRPETLPAIEPVEQTKPTIRAPDVDAVLNKWKQASATYQTLNAGFAGRVYDKAGRVRKISRGRAYYNATGKGRIDRRMCEVKADELHSSVKSTYLSNFESDSFETLVWAGKYAMQFNRLEQTVAYQALSTDWLDARIPNPQAMLTRIVDSKTADFQLQITKHDGLGITISAKPIEGTNASKSLSEAIFVLDPDTYLTKYVKYVDASANLETAYVFSKWNVNEPRPDMDEELAVYWRCTDIPQFVTDEVTPVVAPKPMSR